MAIHVQKKDCLSLGFVSLFTLSTSYADSVTFDVFAPNIKEPIGTVYFEDKDDGVMANIDINLCKQSSACTYANKQHAFHVHQCAECKLNSSASSCNPATGQTMATSPPGQAMTTPPQGQAMTTPPQGQAMTTPPQGQAMTTPPQGQAMATSPQGQAMATSPQGQAMTTPSQGQAMTTPPQGQAMTTTPATTGNYLSAGSHFTKQDWDNYTSRGYGNKTQSSQTMTMSQHHLGPYQPGHVGDMPVLSADDKGKIHATIFSQNLKVKMLKNRSIIFHDNGDNYYYMPDPVGGGGARIACGMMRKTEGTMPKQEERRGGWFRWW